jgi:RND family efflux transporter MFP subunit
MPVNLTQVARRELASEVTYQATITAILEIPMSPEIDGRIVAMPMREGAFVKAGTMLYQLDQMPLESQAKADQAVAENARLNAMRFVGANFAGAVSNKESDDYATKARQSQEIFHSRKATLAYKYVRAPIDGQIGAIKNKLGDYVTAGTAVSTLVDNRHLWVSIDVPAALGYRLRSGQRVRLKAPGLPESQNTAIVTFIAPELDEQRQTLLVRATIDNPTGVLRHKQRVEASLQMGRAEQITIPTTATQLQAGQSFVFVAHPLSHGRYTLEQRPVKLGQPQQDRYPVVSGLNPGELVAIGNLSELSNGIRVQAERPAP